MNESRNSYFPQIADISKAYQRVKNVVKRTPLEYNANLSEEYQAQIYLKREDLQIVRSYKIRGAYNKMSCLSQEELERGVVCASAGNHAQGLAYACNKLRIKGTIFMPAPTPKQKVRQVRMFGKEYVEIVLTGDTFDDAQFEADVFCRANNMVYIPPFNSKKIIEGQGTIAIEILEDADQEIDFMFIPVGGGGLSSGVGAYFKQVSPHTQIIGVEPLGAPAMYESLRTDNVVTLGTIDKFVDGAAVKKVGHLNFPICKEVLKEVALVPEGKVCSCILKLYNEEAIVVEPSGVLSIAVLDQYREQIKGKTVVCILSGSNNDITRMEEIKERSLLYEGLKHYFIINFPQRAGALREFLNDVLSPTDDITTFEYTKKINREDGPALVGIEIQQKEDYNGLIDRMNKKGIRYQLLKDNPDVYRLLI
ncbi:MAG TPA: threonine ammonia-lyase [Paludibacteraceae bacterium]|nr:threonine ammonia-lyase [Paludibacteraceae bacterium]HOR40681.1 threonine ammonia-lyase [Paludibacteraceae bacterium]HPL93588.1 threonine ammonia-lyase [Paludibacteraceae bacterium]